MSLSNDAGIQVGSLQSVPDRLKCPVCTFVLRDPVQGVCGHRYCKVCVTSSDTLNCIECQREGEEDVPNLSADSVKPDTAMMRELNKTEFLCPWEPQCHVQMKLQELMKHAESECSHRRIECDLKCGKMLPASDMETHKANECPMKPKQCTECEEFVPQDQMEWHLNSVCIKNTKQCESCTARVADSDEARMKHYLEVCPIKWIDGEECPFGCGVVQDARAHRKEFVALHVDRLCVMEKKAKQVRDVAGSAGLEGPDDHGKVDVNEERTTVRDNGDARLNFMNQCSAGPFAAHLGKRQESDSHRTQTPNQLFNQVCNTVAQKPLTQEDFVLGDVANCVVRYGLAHCPTQTREIREQQEFFARISFAFNADKALEKEHISMDRKLKDVYSSVDQLSGQLHQQQEELIRASDTYSGLLRAMAMKEIRIYELDRKISLHELGSTDGTLVWKIPFCRERLSDTEYEPIVPSPILYAEKFGYKVSAVAYLNGHSSGHGSHLSLFARLLRGPHDAALRWPFRRTVTFTLMDQSGSNHLVREFKPDQSSQFQRPSQPLGQMFGFEKFALKDELESKGFLKDDTLFVKLQVSKPTLTQGDF